MPIHLAAGHGHEEFVEVLIEEYHVDPKAKEMVILIVA